ncbi:DUF4190 domain-containing protein [Saccharopolyspora sp. NPDC000359]|uniref:DUF4190 domain-containing protein n=1 Tax=Saccharopolyspora sp. NPDC000359 TaxID=3154251 RepID=UPI00331D886B
MTDVPDRPPAAHVNGLAVASLVVSVIALIICIGSFPLGLVGLLGAVLGHVALGRISRAPARYCGRGLAIGGLAVGWCALGLGVLGTAYFFFSAPAQFAELVGAIFGQ